MGDKVTLNLDGEQSEALKDMAQEEADSVSEAGRMALSAGLSKYGYTVNGQHSSWVAWAFGELAKISAYAGIGWLMATLFFPVELRALSVMFFAVALGFIGAERGWVAWQDRKTEQASNGVDAA